MLVLHKIILMSKVLVVLSLVVISAVSCSRRTVESVRVETKDKLVYVDRKVVDSISVEVVKIVKEPFEVKVDIPCGEVRTSTTLKSGKTSVNIIPNNSGGYDLDLQNISDTCTYEKQYRELKEQLNTSTEVNHTISDSTTVTVPPNFWVRLGLKFYQMVSLVLLILWAVGITPKFLYKLIVRR